RENGQEIAQALKGRHKSAAFPHSLSRPLGARSMGCAFSWGVARALPQALLSAPFRRFEDGFDDSSYLKVPGSGFEVQGFRAVSLLRFAAVLGCMFDHHRLDIHEFANAFSAQFPAVAGLLHPAERHSRIGSYHPVKESYAGLNLVDEQLLFLWVIGP